MSVKVIESEDDQGYCAFMIVCDGGHECSIHGFGQDIKTIRFCPACGAKVTHYEHMGMIDGKLGTITEQP